MFSQLPLRPMLLATSSLVVIGVGLVLSTEYRQPVFTDPDQITQPSSEVTSLMPAPDIAAIGALESAPMPEPVAPLDAVVADDGLADALRVTEAERMDAPAPHAATTQLPQITQAPMVRSSKTAAAEMAPAANGPIAGLSAIAPAPGMRRAPQLHETAPIPAPDTETFASAAPNALKITAEEPVSTFSIDVDTASYAFVRRALREGRLPPADAVRSEEMINYFAYAYPVPDGPHPFATRISVSATPWNPGTRLVHIGIQGALPDIAERPPLDLVFLIDTSGSMQDADKLPLLKQSLRLMLGELRPADRVAIVAYAGSAGQVLAPTPAADRATILAALERLDAGGSTAGQEGLQQAYALAQTMARDGAGDQRVGRVILATDGDFNVGLSDPESLKSYIAEKRDSGTYLSVLGFGRGNLDDATMQALAQNGNGQAAYIDTLHEAQKVLVDQLTGALYPIANDVKIQVEFNPMAVAEYRLIGYETRALAREDFNNDTVDAGEIGAGHQVTAIYEITPVGSPALRNDPLRYGTANMRGDPSELGFLKLRYKRPGESESLLIERPIGTAVSEPGTDVRFASAIAGFAQLLRDDKYLEGWGYDEAIALATDARGDDRFGYRAEAISLMRLAQSLNANR